MRRRDLIARLGGVAVAWPFSARAQEVRTPTVGFLSSLSRSASDLSISELRQGLAEAGYAEGKNLLIEYRWADGQYERLLALALELVRHPVSVVSTNGGIIAALTAKAVTSTIPIVFTVGDDPVRHGLVESLSRPGGNATGVYIIAADLSSKRLELLHELVPSATSVAVLTNRSNPNAQTMLSVLEEAARLRGLQLHFLYASNEPSLVAAFASLRSLNFDALFVGADPFFYSRQDKVIELVAQLGKPAIYEGQEFADAGGLVSYGPRRREAARLAGVYTGRILAGAKPGELPVQTPATFELVINLKAAKALKFEVPASLLVRADEVIE